MAIIKRLRNQSGTDKQILNRTVSNGEYYEIPYHQWFELATNENIPVWITNGDIIVNDGTSDLSPSDGLSYILRFQYDEADKVSFSNSTNGFISTNVQEAIEELGGTPIGSVSVLIYTELGVASNEWLDYQANSVYSDQTHAILPYGGKLFAITAANENSSKEINIEIQKAAANAGTTTTRVATFQCRNFRAVRFSNFTPINFNAGDKIGVYVDRTGLSSPPSNLVVTLYFQITESTVQNVKENYSGDLSRKSTGGVTITHS